MRTGRRLAAICLGVCALPGAGAWTIARSNERVVADGIAGTYRRDRPAS